MLPAQWIGDAGVLGAVIAFLIGGLMCIFVGLTYAELTSAFPLAGGELAFSYRGMGYLGSWVTGWTISFAYIGVAAWEGIALSSAFHYMIPIAKIGFLWNVAGFDVYISWSLVGIIGAVTLTLLNIIGVKPRGSFSDHPGHDHDHDRPHILFLEAWPLERPESMTPVFTDVKGIGMVLLMAPSMYIGFDMVSKSAEEYEHASPGHRKGLDCFHRRCVRLVYPDDHWHRPFCASGSAGCRLWCRRRIPQPMLMNPLSWVK